jgi:hypothetical protein
MVLAIVTVVLATFHSRLGYARPWPSQIPGSCSTKRDFLGELIAAAHAKGLRVILYMTDDPQWHDERGVESFDSAAYSAYKGHPVDLRRTRHVRLTIHNTWGSPTVPAFYNKPIDEMYVIRRHVR